MNTDILRKEFEEILALEIRAKHYYEHFIDQIDDERIKGKITSIRDDEKAHIKIAEKLIEFVS